MAISLTFTPTRGDLVRVGLLGVIERRSLFYSSAICFIALPWLFALVGLVAQIFGLTIIGWPTILLMVALPFATVLSFALIPPILLWLFGDAPTLKGPLHYIFSDKDIHASGPSFDTHLSWGALTHFRFHPLGLLLRGNNKVPMVYIPARTVSESVQRELVELFKSKGITPSAGR